MSLKDSLDTLGDLYVITGWDWELTIHHILTEPTCPTVVINPEDWNITRYRVDCNTIEEGIKLAVTAVKTEVLERKIVGSCAPFTNSDDGIFLDWLKERASGSDAELIRKKDGD